MAVGDVVQWLAFAVLSLTTLVGALAVVINRNLFHSALWLLVSLFGVAGLFVMLSAPFLAAVQVLVYMGAIVILIIFAIMLTQRMMGIREAPNHQWPVGLVMAALAFLVLAFVLIIATSNGSDVPLIPSVAVATPSINSIATLGIALVDPSQYALPFEVASLLLMGAMIGAIVVGREDA